MTDANYRSEEAVIEAAQRMGEPAEPAACLDGACSGVACAVTYIDIDSDSAHENVKLYLSLRGETKL